MEHHLANELITEINQGRCLLFLGSGSSVACESSSGGGLTGEGLSQAIVRSMGEDPSNFTATLMEASEYLEAHTPQHRNALDTFIYDRLHDLRPTVGHILTTLFRWKAVVTTNYNRVVETGYEVAGTAGVTRFSCVPIRTDNELEINAIGPDQTPLFKPHGCLSLRNNPDSPMVLTAKDYYFSTKKRRKMYEHIKQLAGRFSTLFIGYSLVDYNFNNIYYPNFLKI
ncbi:MAG: SIR2 family protein [Tissierellales bacterium]|nr:SIR2 family protein [Tissierellales bacterium]